MAYFVLLHKYKLMKTLSFKIFTLAFMLLCSISLVRADVFDDITQTFRTMDSRNIANHFDTSIELKIDENSNTYSKIQAEMVLKNFFDQIKPNQFTLIHKGAGNRGTTYAIGNVETEKGKYRFYIYFKDIPGNFIIQQLNIEKS